MSQCTYHSSKEAVFACRHCQREICESCTIKVEGEPFCQICWDGYAASVRDIKEEKNDNESPAASIPWQSWRELGPLRAFMETAKQVVFQPVRFFSNLPKEKGMLTPLLFAVICIMIFWFPMNILYIKLIFPSILDNISPEGMVLFQTDSEQSPAEVQQEIRQRFLSVSNSQILSMPLNYLLFHIFLASMMQQVLILFFKGREGFNATFQIRCYSMIAQCLLIVPFIGIFMAEIGSVFMCLRGFQIVQKLTFLQALCVSVVPVMVSFLVVFGII